MVDGHCLVPWHLVPGTSKYILYRKKGHHDVWGFAMAKGISAIRTDSHAKRMNREVVRQLCHPYPCEIVLLSPIIYRFCCCYYCRSNTIEACAIIARRLRRSLKMFLALLTQPVTSISVVWCGRCLKSSVFTSTPG